MVQDGSDGPNEPWGPDPLRDDPETVARSVEGELDRRLAAMEDSSRDEVEVDETTAPGWLRPLLRFAHAADRLTERAGAISKYLVILAVIIGFGNVVLRYIGRAIGKQLSSNVYIELQWYLFGTLFLLGFAYILKHGINVRVDFWSSKQSPRTQAIIDTVGHLIALIPFCILAIRVSWGPVLRSWGQLSDGSFRTWKVWQVWEQSPDAGGLPRAPIKTMILIGFVLLLLQAIAELIKLTAVLSGHGHRIDRVEGMAGMVKIE